MTRHILGLHRKGSDCSDELEGIFLVRVDRAFYRWHPTRPFYLLRFVAPESEQCPASREVPFHRVHLDIKDQCSQECEGGPKLSSELRHKSLCPLWVMVQLDSLRGCSRLLACSGPTLLVPNLSLNVERQRQSPCDATWNWGVGVHHSCSDTKFVGPSRRSGLTRS